MNDGEDDYALRNTHVRDLNLPVRVRKCLNRIDVKTLGELADQTAEGLLDIKNFGMTCLVQVQEKLKSYGLRLRGKDDPPAGYGRFITGRMEVIEIAAPVAEADSAIRSLEADGWSISPSSCSDQIHVQISATRALK